MIRIEFYDLLFGIWLQHRTHILRVLMQIHNETGRLQLF